ncbi:hypothetical protein F5Y10DRAFT_293870 [Nemania abortiva]|nr:hypothetical protein F5Y10DRAFT_293870 [Nemania abortiva]
MTVRVKELEDAVCDVIQIIKQIPELTGARLAVIGDLALCHYLPDRRPTDKITFITDLPALEFLGRKLLNHPNSPFWKTKQALFYRSPAGRDIEIEFSPQWLFPYLPDSTPLVYEIPYGKVPYAMAVDLFFFKLNSSLSVTTNPAKRRQDGDDAAALISRDNQDRFADGYIPTTKEQLRRLQGANDVQPMVILSPQQEQFIKDALRGEDLTVSSVMHSPPLA